MVGGCFPNCNENSSRRSGDRQVVKANEQIMQWRQIIRPHVPLSRVSSALRSMGILLRVTGKAHRDQCSAGRHRSARPQACLPASTDQVASTKKRSGWVAHPRKSPQAQTKQRSRRDRRRYFAGQRRLFLPIGELVLNARQTLGPLGTDGHRRAGQVAETAAAGMSERSAASIRDWRPLHSSPKEVL